MFRNNRSLVMVGLTVVLLSGCATAGVQSAESKTEELLALNAALSNSMIVDRDETLFDETAVDNFRVLAPGGVLENKGQVIRGLAAWDVAGIEISREEVVFHGDIAVVTNRLDIDGTMQPIGRWGPLKSMRVFVHEDGRWRLVSQSLTPCLPKAVEVGRC